MSKKCFSNLGDHASEFGSVFFQITEELLSTLLIFVLFCFVVVVISFSFFLFFFGGGGGAEF